MITSTIGATGRDYPDPQAWWDDLPATWVDDYTGDCYNDAEFTSAVNFTGLDPDGFRAILTAAAGQSFVDNAGAATNPQFYDQSVGVGIRASPTFTPLVACDNANVTISRLQFRVDSALLTAGIIATGDANLVSRCIMSTVGDAFGAPTAQIRGSGTRIQYTLLVSDGESSLGLTLFGARAINCLVYNRGLTGTPGTGVEFTFDQGELYNCRVFGYSTATTGTPVGEDYNDTDLASGFTGTNSEYNKVFADEYVADDDLRLLSTNTALFGTDAYSADTGDDDIIEQPQPGSPPWYVGQWAYQSGGGGITGSGNIPFPVFQVAGAGSVERKGTGNILLPVFQVSGSGVVTRKGTGNIPLPAFVVAGAGERVIPGSGNIPLPALQVAGAGVVSDVISGSGNIPLPALQVAGSGTVTRKGTGNIPLPALQVAGSGTVTHSGTGNIPLPVFQVSGSGIVGSDILGSGNIPFPALQVNGSGFRSVVGNGNILLPALQVSGSGKKSVFGTGNILLPVFRVNGSGGGGGDPGSEAFIGDIAGPGIEGPYEIEGPSIEGVRGGIF